MNSAAEQIAMRLWIAAYMARRPHRATYTDLPHITCPICEMTSYHPKDIEYGYCGYCHAFTRIE